MEKTGQVQAEDLYSELEVLATNLENALAMRHFCDLETYRKSAQLLSELRGLLLSLSKTETGKKAAPLLDRFLYLEGKIKEMRNDLTYRKV